MRGKNEWYKNGLVDGIEFSDIGGESGGGRIAGGISHPIRRAVTCSRQLPQEGAPKGPVSLLPAVGTSATPTEGDNVGKFCLMSCETTNTAKHQFLSQHLQSDNHQTPNKL